MFLHFPHSNMRCLSLSLLTLMAPVVLAGTIHFNRQLTKRDLTPASDLPGSWSYYGCYSDSVSARVLSGASYSDDSAMTDESCVNYCNSKGYSFAGVEYAQECYCGYGLASSSTSYAGDCTMACTGDSTEPCGAGDRLSVFTNGGKGPQTNPGPAGWSSMGCYSDSVSSRSLSNGVAHDQSAQMTVELCTSACQSAGYSLAGVEYAGECYCDNSLQGGHLVSGNPSDSGCNMACNGDSSEYCGGPDRLNLYTATSNAPTSTTVSTDRHGRVSIS